MSKENRKQHLERQLLHAEQVQRSLYKRLVEARQHQKLKLTDHAVVRFFERHKKVYLYEVAQDQIITEGFMAVWSNEALQKCRNWRHLLLN